MDDPNNNYTIVFSALLLSKTSNLVFLPRPIVQQFGSKSSRTPTYDVKGLFRSQQSMSYVRVNIGSARTRKSRKKSAQKRSNCSALCKKVSAVFKCSGSCFGCLGGSEKKSRPKNYPSDRIRKGGGKGYHHGRPARDKILSLDRTGREYKGRNGSERRTPLKGRSRTKPKVNVHVYGPAKMEINYR